MSTILCDGEIIDDIIVEFGVSVTAHVVTETNPASTADGHEYNEPTYAEADHVVTALVESVNSDELRVQEGLFRGGDLYIHFQTDDQSYASVGNFVTYSGTKYKITRVDKETRGDTIYVAGARAEKYN